MKTSPVQLEIFRNRFQAIVEEMASVTLRTGFTVFVKETSDFGACLVAPSGEVLAAPTETSVSLMVGLPGWEAIGAFDDYEDGDVCIANDPDTTRGLSTHLPDIWVWRPIFVDGEIIAFAFNFIHSSDVGGRVPGSITPVATDVWQEGLRIPPLKLVRAGRINDDIVKLILTNCRIPDQNWGDIKAELASLATADRRVKELAKRYGRDAVRHGIEDLLASAEARARKIISSIPDGRYSASDYMEIGDGNARPIRIALTMEVRGDEIALDFTGSDIQVKAAFNLPTYGQPGHYMLSLAILNYFRTLDPEIPYNSGLTRPLSMVLPRGTIVNPDPGRAYGVRAATFIRVMDCIMACLGQALPAVTPANSAGAIAIILVSNVDPGTGQRRITVAQPLSGGSGGRPVQDGIDGTSFTGGWLRNVPNEVLEAEMPVLVEEYGYATDSAAPGQRRGGAGIRFRMRNLQAGTVLTARGLERFRFNAWGALGGAPGANTRVTLNPGGEAKPLGQIDLVELGRNDVVEFVSPTGGGYGDPYLRDPQHVLDDVLDAYISEDAARSGYGVAIDGDVVDAAATEALRKAHRPTSGTNKGCARADFERQWPETVQHDLIMALLALPSAVRDTLRAPLEARIQASLRSGELCGRAEIDAMIADMTHEAIQ
ncbi:hydantoinase B/oxoprolinase family protein [Chelatococcus asaccharovorans]|uniref:hydantoinase B/oxoprolinase family protein n=1 Tax=Chelatococcus asaccharovorans TaxID=28210 RepID=UPI00224C7608|nr:hydantoinase B/oxoprolinase family protein [Chelatococcus asaccharovorans]CAH1650420.1 N-methylhydantoinase B [Chelatococcus asaccharovorans]CAH1692273.1 N-methylhydantoinase B [Chelatococcus asaccharovorans]